MVNNNYVTSDIIGISEEGLKKLGVDMLSYRDEFSSIFEDVMQIIDESKAYFSGETGEIFRKKFFMFSKNFKLVSSSMENYSEDFFKVVKSYKNHDAQK